MSRVVDQKVVEMQFDNRHFERNVSTTMSTLDKLKQSLKLPDASKSLDGINKSAKNVNLSGIGSAVDTVQAKFSALQVAGVTALANITNSAVNYGKRIVKALTIDPVTTGFNEYELKMGSIQTIMASTGESLDTVNKYLEELNKYSDQTIYSFSDMTSSIGKFTNAGVKLDDAVMAIKGISNEAAVSGATAAQASQAMYNFAQALSAGYVKLIDWKSIENANMATVEFKQQLIDTAVELKTVTKGADGMYKTLEGNAFNATKNFNDVLQDQWMTTDVLITTLGKYASETTDIGKKATAAATEVKTFSMMMDTLKESVQSGWAQTWEIVVGDFEEAKEIFTKLSNFLGGIIEKISNARNELLGGVLSSPWENISKKIAESGINLDEFENKLKATAKKHNKELEKMSDKELTFDRMLKDGIITKELVIETLKDYVGNLDGMGESTEDMSDKLKRFQKVVDQVWHGDFKNGEARIKALTEAGYNYAEVQALVNKTVDGHRLTLKDLSDEQLKSIGYTDEQIEAIKKLADEAEKAETPLSTMLDRLDKKSGRELIIESIVHIMGEFQKILEAVSEAWDEAFGDINMTDMLYGLIERLHGLAMELEITEDKANNFKKVFEGLFAAFQISNMMISATFTAGLKILSAVLDLFGTDLVEVAGYIADYIVKLRDWIEEHTFFIDTYNKIAKVVKVFIDGIRQCVDAIMSLQGVQNIVKKVKDKFVEWFGEIDAGIDAIGIDTLCEKIGGAFTKIRNWIESLNDSKNLGKDMIDGLIIGLQTGLKKVVDIIVNLATSLIQAFADTIKSNSPSKVFIALGGFIILGLLAGLQNGFGWVLDAMKNFATSIIDIFNNINLNHVIVAVFAGAMLLLVKKMMGIMAQFASLPEGIGKFFSGLGDMFENFGKAKVLKAQAAKMSSIAKIVMSVAFAIAAITAAMYILGNMENDQLIKAGIALTAMIVVIGLIMLLAKLMNKIKGVETSFVSIISIAGSLLMLSLAMVMLTKADMTGVPGAIKLMFGMVGSLSLLLAAFGIFAKGGTKGLGRVGRMMTQMSIALLLMVGVVKLASMLTPEEIDQGLLTVSKMTGIFAAILVISSISPAHVSKVGGMMLKISVALLLMIGVIKLSALITEEELTKAIDVMGQVGIFFMCIIAASSLSGENAHKAGALILGMAVALAAVVFVIKKVGELTEEQIDKGIEVIAKVSLLFAGIIAVSKFAGGNAIKAGIMLIAMATAMIVITGAIYLLASIPNGLDQALTAVTVVGLIFAGLIAVTKFAGEDVKGTIIAITVSITMLAVALAALSFIPEDKLTIATGAMLAALTALGLLMLATKAMGNVTGTLIGLSIAIGVLGGVLYLIGTLDTDSAMGAAMSLSGLLLVLGIVLTMLDKMNGPSAKALIALGVVTLVVGALAAVLYFMQDVDATHALQITGVLTLFLAALLVALFAMQLLQAPSIMGLVALGAVTLVVAALAGILYMMQGVDPTQALGITIALSIFLAAMTIVCFAAAAIGPVAGPALIGLGVLLLFVGALGLVLLALADLAMDVLAGMPKLGQDLSDFMTNAQGFIDGIQKVPDNIGDKVALLCGAIGALTTQELFNSIKEFFSGGDSIADLGKELEDFGNSIASFTKNADVTSVTAVTDAITDLIDLDFSSSDANIENFHKSMEELAGNAVDSFADELSSSDSKTKAKDAIGEVVTAASDKAKSQTGYNAFYNAGKSLVEGLAQGIRDKKYAAVSAAVSVANAVETIIRDAWEVNSPSKLFYRIALGIGEGITDGVVDSGSSVYGSAGLFANKVTKGFTKALDMVNSIISNDMDIQPTIRPVLDLSSVESGVGAMNGLLSNKTVGVNANIGAISTMMSSRGQNGTNGDVVSAIDRLRKDLGKTGNTYNSINGITYDDGSEVSNAVRVLVRAAKIERRV